MDGLNYRLQLLINADNVASITIVLELSRSDSLFLIEAHVIKPWNDWLFELMVLNFISVTCIYLFILKQMWLFHLTARSVQSLSYASVFHCIPATWSNVLHNFSQRLRCLL